MPDILNLSYWEWFRLRRRVGFLALAALAILATVLILAVAVAQNMWRVAPVGDLSFFSMVGSGLPGVAPLLAIILPVLVFASDLQNGNARALACRGDHRLRILTAKALLAAALLAAYHVLSYGLAILAALALDPHFEGWAAASGDVAASLLNSLLYLSLGIFLCHWRESTAFAVGVGVVFIAFESIAYPILLTLGQAFGWGFIEIAHWTLWGVTNGLQGDLHDISRLWFIPIVAGYTAALIAVAAALFYRADLRAGPA